MCRLISRSVPPAPNGCFWVLVVQAIAVVLPVIPVPGPHLRLRVREEDVGSHRIFAGSPMMEALCRPGRVRDKPGKCQFRGADEQQLGSEDRPFDLYLRSESSDSVFGHGGDEAFRVQGED